MDRLRFRGVRTRMRRGLHLGFVGGAAIAGTWLLVAALADAASRNESVLPDGFNAVIIDAGHGGHDEGALGANGLAEKDLVLDVSRRLAKRLKARGLRVVLTRDQDVFVPLETRTSVANDARGNLFVSIHANASKSANAKGVETYFASPEYTDEAASEIARRENEAFGAAAALRLTDDPLQALLGDMIANEHYLESDEFARLAQAELKKVDPAPSRGVKQAPFVVLMGVQMPAALVEIGFLTNPDEAGRLRGGGHRNALADALARAVTAFAKRYDARRGVSARLSALQGGE